jgi:hypothetical protein
MGAVYRRLKLLIGRRSGGNGAITPVRLLLPAPQRLSESGRSCYRHFVTIGADSAVRMLQRSSKPAAIIAADAYLDPRVANWPAGDPL